MCAGCGGWCGLLLLHLIVIVLDRFSLGALSLTSSGGTSDADLPMSPAVVVVTILPCGNSSLVSGHPGF